MSFPERFVLTTLITLFLINPSASCQILEILPDPYGDDSREYVRVFCDDSCTLTDFESTFNLSEGINYIANNASAFLSHYGFRPDFEGIRLSNRGEDVVLICGEDEIRFNWKDMYRDSGVVYFQSESGWDFRYEDWSSFKPVKEHVKGRIMITPAKYTLSGDGFVASYTITADVFRGNFTFAVDSSPVGGIPAEEILLAKKYKFHFLKGPYRNFHYKYAVLDDDRVIVTTENWKWDNRGVIVEYRGEKSAEALRKLFEYDLQFDSVPSAVSEVGGDYRGGNPEVLEFEGNVTLYIMPDSNPVFDFIEGSNGFLYIAVPYMGFDWFTRESPLLNALMNASERGVEIRILLNDYEKNRKTAEFLNSIPNISAKLVRSPEFDELHGKYMITDGKVLVTSANFNKYGLKLNREIALVIEDREAGRFMKSVFESDWERKSEMRPVISLTFLGIALLLGFYFLKRAR